MKTIGLIGGMSWESTVTYYRIINETIKNELGGLHSAKCVLYSVDFQEIEECQSNGDWKKSAVILAEAAQALEKARAAFVVICTNTMHKVVPEIRNSINIPVFHIAEITAKELKKSGITTVGLLGTKYTMQQDFYKQVLMDHGISVIIPPDNDMEFINSVIYNELCLGIISETSHEESLRIIADLHKCGAKGIVLGCTEIGLLVNQKDTSVPLFDTTLIHARGAALEAISNNNSI